MEFIDLKTQYETYKDEIDRRMREVVDHGQFIMGPEIDELESVLAEYVGVKHCITVASGTDSLEIALRALDIGPGDEVITVPFSWISTAEVIAAVGATPVFIDIEPETFNMNADLLDDAITKNTKAIMPVSLFGQMPDFERIDSIAKKHNIAVIEDAAQSFGATWNGKPSCGASLIGSTSFFPAKPLGCFGDGGALFTEDDDLADIMRAIRSHGGVKRHHHTHIGMNGRFDTLQAAVILGKWPHFEDEVKARNQIGARYSELLKDHVTTPKVAEGKTHVYAQYTIRVDENKRDDIVAGLKDAGIPVGIYYPKCFHEQPVFEYLGYEYGDFPESERASREVLSLPMHPFLNKDDQNAVCKNLLSVFNKLK
jgi:UDP-2-acetamido-2-deoxy-ribo-hexuluronate aminotransferase